MIDVSEAAGVEARAVEVGVISILLRTSNEEWGSMTETEGVETLVGVLTEVEA